MRHIRGNTQDLASPHHNLFATDGEFKRAFENISQLLIVMVVQRNMRAFLHQHARQHNLVAHQHFPIDLRIEVFALHVLPRGVFQLRAAHFLSPYSLVALSCKYMCASSRAFASLMAFSATNSASASATAVRAERTASQNVSSAPTASLNGKASEPNMIFSGYNE